MLERDTFARKGTDDIEEQAGRQDDGAVPTDLRGRDRDAQADLHVGGTQLGAALRGLQLNAGQRLDGRSASRPPG